MMTAIEITQSGIVKICYPTIHEYISESNRVNETDFVKLHNILTIFTFVLEEHIPIHCISLTSILNSIMVVY